jgi:hypothetical protein
MPADGPRQRLSLAKRIPKTIARQTRDMGYVPGPRIWPAQILNKTARLAEWEVDASNPWPGRIEEGAKRIERLQTLNVIDGHTIAVELALGARNRF